MEFWGIEVKAGEPFKVELHEKRALHLSQACIGEVEKESSESICLFASINGKTFVLGTLNTEKLPQQTFDLVFDKTFELFHKWKNGSVFFHGYTADNETSDHPVKNYNDSDSGESSSDEDIRAIAPNGPATKVKQEVPKFSAGKDSTAGKQKVKIAEPKKDVSSEDSDDSSDDDDETSSEDEPKVSSGKDSDAGKQKMKIMEPKKDASSEDSDDTSDDDTTSSEDEPKVSARKDSAAGKEKAKIVEPKNDTSSEDDADSSDDEENQSASDEDSDEDEVTPVQVKSGKKRASVSASKTAVSQKKAKLSTPQKTDGKKSSVHVDTPYPSKQAGKAPANKPNQQTPKTEGSHSYKPCKRTFKSEGALESHNKAKHSGGK